MWQRRQAIPDFPCCLKPKQKWSSSRAHSQWKRSSAVCVIVRLMHQWGAQHRTSNSDRLPTLKSLKLSSAKKLFWFSRSGTKLHCHLTESQTLTLLSWHLRSLWLKPHKRNHLRCLVKQRSGLQKVVPPLGQVTGVRECCFFLRRSHKRSVTTQGVSEEQ